jgi:hypothetical protein
MPRGAKKGEARRKGIPNKDRAALAQIIERVIPTTERIELLAQLARGVRVQGEIGVYTTKPDAAALRDLNDRQYGKPGQALEITYDEEELSNRGSLDLSKLTPDEIVIFSDILKRIEWRSDPL